MRHILQLVPLGRCLWICIDTQLQLYNWAKPRHAAAQRLQDLQHPSMPVSPTSQSFRVFVKAIVAGWDNCRKPMPRPTSCRTHTKMESQVMAGVQTGIELDWRLCTVRKSYLSEILQQLQVIAYATTAQLLPG